MTSTNPYLFFDGNCREAFALYAQVLGAKPLMMLSYAEGPEPSGDDGCPEGEPFPDAFKDRIMHGRLEIGGSILMASDAPPGRYSAPQGFALNADTASVAEAERVFAALSEGGSVTMPIAETFWAERFGMLTDRFGIPWMVNFEKPQGA